MVITASAVAAFYGVRYSKESAEAAKQQAAIAAQNRADAVAQGKIAQAAKPISLDQSTGATGTVPLCADLSGHAETIAGFVLWVAHKGRKDEYYLRKPTRDGAYRWFIKRWTIGDQKSTTATYEVSAFYVDEKTSALLDGLKVHSKDPRSSWYVTTLPASLGTVKQSWMVKRDGIENEKPC